MPIAPGNGAALLPPLGEENLDSPLKFLAAFVHTKLPGGFYEPLGLLSLGHLLPLLRRGRGPTSSVAGGARISTVARCHGGAHLFELIPGSASLHPGYDACLERAGEFWP